MSVRNRVGLAVEDREPTPHEKWEMECEKIRILNEHRKKSGKQPLPLPLPPEPGVPAPPSGADEAPPKSTYHGVQWDQPSKKWVAYAPGPNGIGVRRTTAHATEEGAARAYDRVLVEYKLYSFAANFPAELPKWWCDKALLARAESKPAPTPAPVEPKNESRRELPASPSVAERTKYDGVRYVPKASQTNPWQARFACGGKVHHVGCYPTAEAAARAHDKAVVEMGADRKLNFPAEWPDYEPTRKSKFGPKPKGEPKAAEAVRIPEPEPEPELTTEPEPEAIRGIFREFEPVATEPLDILATLIPAAPNIPARGVIAEMADIAETVLEMLRATSHRRPESVRLAVDWIASRLDEKGDD